jgi:signal transduction histidine kinase
MKWSAELEAMHRLPPGSFPGTFDAFEKGIHPSDRHLVLQAIRGALEGRNTEVQYRIVLADGELRWLEAHEHVLAASDGQPASVIGICLDITERKQAEDERRGQVAREQLARHELERVGGLYEQFLTMLSHDLRTPLNATVIWANLLSSGSLPPEKVRRAIDSIVRNAQAQVELVQSFLELSKIVSGTLQLHTEHLDLGSILRSAAETLRGEIEKRGITLQMAIPGVPITVVADRDRMREVFANVLTSSLMSTPDAGHAEVHIVRMDSKVQVQFTGSSKRVDGDRLSPPVDQQPDADAPTRSKESLGVGFMIARELVRAHGGTLAAHSQGQGQGSTFILTLPISPEDGSPGHHAG